MRGRFIARSRSGGNGVPARARAASLFFALLAVPSVLAQVENQLAPQAAAQGGKGEAPSPQTAASVLRRLVLAGCGEEALASLPEAPPALADAAPNNLGVGDAIAGLAGGAVVPPRIAPVVDEKLAPAIARAERLLGSGSDQAAFRMLDELAARAPRAGLERMLAQAALRAGREGAAFDACLRAVRAGTTPEGDEASMLWLAAQSGLAQAGERAAMLARVRQLATASPALAAAASHDLAMLLGAASSMPATGAAAELEAQARAAIGKLGEGDAWASDVWYAGPLARTIARIRASGVQQSAQGADLALLRGDAAQALAMATVEYAAATPGSKEAWDEGVRVVAAHAAMGSFVPAAEHLLTMLREQRSSRAEHAWKLAVELAQLAESSVPGQGKRVAFMLNVAPSAVAPAANDEAAWALSVYREVMVASVSSAVLAAFPPADAADKPSRADMRYAAIGSAATSSTTSGMAGLRDADAVRAVAFAPAVRAVLGMLARTPKGAGDVHEAAVVLAEIARQDSATLHEAARGLIATAGAAACEAWATQEQAEGQRALRAALLVALGKFDAALALVGDPQRDAVLHELRVRALVSAQQLDKLEAALADVLALEHPARVLQPLMLEGRFEAMAEAFASANVNASPHGAWLAALLPASHERATRVRSEVQNKVKAFVSSKDDTARQAIAPPQLAGPGAHVNWLAQLALSPTDDAQSKQAFAQLRRFAPMVDAWPRVQITSEWSRESLLVRAKELAEKGSYIEAEAVAGHGLRLASVGLQALRKRGNVPPVRPSTARRDATIALARACDPRVVVRSGDAAVAAAARLMDAAANDAPIEDGAVGACPRMVAVQLAALAGLVDASEIVTRCMRVPRGGAATLDLAMLAAADEGLGMRGDTTTRIDLVMQAMKRSPDTVERLGGLATVRLGSWATADATMAIVQGLCDNQAGAEGLDKAPCALLGAWVDALALDNPPAEQTQQAYAAELLYVIANFAHGDLRDAEAEKIYREVLRRVPNHTWAANNLAYFILERGGDLGEAERLLELAIAQMPDSASIADSVGWLRYKQGKLEDFTRNDERRGGAIAWLERAHRLSMREGRISAEVAMHLGDAYWRRAEALSQAGAVHNDPAHGPAHWQDLAQSMWQVADDEARTRLRAFRAFEEADRNTFVGSAITYAEHVRQTEARLVYARAWKAGQPPAQSPLSPMSIEPTTSYRPPPQRPDLRPRLLPPDRDVCSRFTGEMDDEERLFVEQ